MKQVFMVIDSLSRSTVTSRTDPGRMADHFVRAIRQIVVDLSSVQATKQRTDIRWQRGDSIGIVIRDVADGAGPLRTVRHHPNTGSWLKAD